MAVLSTLLRAALSSSKVVLLLLVLINIHNFPLVWHFRLLFCELLPEVGRTLAKRPWWYLRFRGKSAITRSDVRPVLRTADIYPGTRVFDLRWTRTGRVWPDMADYNLHMSNSSYGWEMDMCRMRFWVRFFPRMISSDGGFSALGGADYTFHAEVPLFGKFNLETSILTWDDKWIYLMGQFVYPIKPGQKRRVYCTSITRYCVKSSRRTVPPWLVIATHGYGADGAASWLKAEQLRAEAAQDPELQRINERSHRAWYSHKPKEPTLYQAYFAALDREKNGAPSTAWTKPETWDLGPLEADRLKGLSLLKGTGGHFTLPKEE